MKIFMITLLFSLAITFNFAQTLTVKIDNYEASEGYIYVAVFDSAEAFESRQTPHRKKISVQEMNKPILFKGLGKGTYCVSVFHDLNNNMQLDTKNSGIPTEPYGLSNNPGFGKPTFDKISFLLEKDKWITIEMRSVKPMK